MAAAAKIPDGCEQPAGKNSIPTEPSPTRRQSAFRSIPPKPINEIAFFVFRLSVHQGCTVHLPLAHLAGEPLEQQVS